MSYIMYLTEEDDDPDGYVYKIEGWRIIGSFFIYEMDESTYILPSDRIIEVRIEEE